REITGNGAARLEGRLDEADGERIGGGKDRGGPGRSVEMPEQAAPEAVARLRVGLGREVDPRLVADPVLGHESLIQAGTERAVGHQAVSDVYYVGVPIVSDVLER